MWDETLILGFFSSFLKKCQRKRVHLDNRFVLTLHLEKIGSQIVKLAPGQRVKIPVSTQISEDFEKGGKDGNAIRKCGAGSFANAIEF